MSARRPPSGSSSAAIAARVPVAIAALALALGARIVPVLAYREGPPPDRVSACGFGPNCSDAGCHSGFPVGSPTLTWMLREEAGPALPAAYVPGRRYRLRFDVMDTDPAAAVFGFELAPLIDCPIPVGGGDVLVVDAGRTRRVEDLGIPYVTHSCLCPAEDASCCGYVPEAVAGANGWPFDWIAPAEGSGTVTFAFAVNSANWNAQPTGDRITLGEAQVPEASCPPRIGDLTVRLAACDPAMPAERRVELAWTDGGGALRIRETSARAALLLDPSAWPLAPEACRPIDGAAVTYYSVAEDCAGGLEGVH